MDVVVVADTIVTTLRSTADVNNWWWHESLFNINSELEAVLEWWHEEKKITIYVSQKSIDYIKVLGADMDNEMEDGSINSENDLTELWRWIAT